MKTQLLHQQLNNLHSALIENKNLPTRPGPKKKPRRVADLPTKTYQNIIKIIYSKPISVTAVKLCGHFYRGQFKVYRGIFLKITTQFYHSNF